MGYVELAYMTGILPIAKYSSGSELNMFVEYNMATSVKYSEYFGFTEKETAQLYERYKRLEKSPHVELVKLREWYDGYQTAKGERIFNPRAVICALTSNQIYGFLSYYDGQVSIPNKELMIKFEDVLTNKKLGYVSKLALESERMLTATLKGDTEYMDESMSVYAH